VSGLRSGFCPKCKTPTVYRKWDGIYQGTARVYVNTGQWMITPSPVDCYICTRCGYFEQYVAADAQKMSEITNTWEKVVRPSQERTEES
jgi:hypothetical protein